MTAVADLIRNHNPDIQAIVSALRKLILETVPTSTESANPGWHSISIRHPDQGYYCGIFPAQDKVTLVFEYGVLLPDPDGILEGDGKQTRNVILYTTNNIPADAIKALLFEAINLPISKAEKLELIRFGASLV